MADSIFKPLTAITNLYLDAPRDHYRIGIPVNANIAADTVGRFANSNKANHIALKHENLDQSTETYTFKELDLLACCLAAYFQSVGIGRGDRVAIHTAQSPQSAISHLAVYKIGAIALTVSHLYRSETLTHIINDAKPKAIVTAFEYWQPVRESIVKLDILDHVIVHGEVASGETKFEDCLATTADDWQPVLTASEDPAILMYSSGSTGRPKGMLHAHRLLHAFLPSLTMVYDLELDYPNAVFWSPADWAWVGGLMDLMLPAWQHGQTVVSCNHRFSAQWGFEFMSRHAITHSFMTPTALKRLAEIKHPREKWPLKLRVVCTGGESLPAEILNWAEAELEIACNEFYGLTEFSDTIGCCRKLFPTIPGSMGRAIPGHHVAIINDEGIEQPDGTVGEIASWHSDEPCLFLGYWGRLGIPAEMTVGNWLRSGDIAMRDKNGYYWYKGRKDDLINSAGYKIGPSEVEESLMSHPFVSDVAVIGKPDPKRGEVVMAFVIVADGVATDEVTRETLRMHVKNNLSAYKYPRFIKFMESLPMTSSGKIKRDILRQLAADHST